MKVTINNYQELASRTCKDLKDLVSNNTHMQMGIITEVGELVDILKKQLAYGKEIDWINVKEELGDIFWYIANYCTFNNLKFEDQLVFCNEYIEERNEDFDTFYSLLNDIVYLVTNDYDYIYNKENLLDILYITNNLVDIVNRFTTFTIEEILQTNIDKLSTRYPEGFSSYYALNRDLDNERNILEKK